jgi:hypothetical protein
MYVTRISRYIYIYIYIYNVRYYPRVHVTSVGLERIIRGYGGPPILGFKSTWFKMHVKA